MTAYARTVEGRGHDAWQPLAAHLAGVAERAASFAAKFDSADHGRLAGAWHDIGKHAVAFQCLLEAAARGEPTSRVDHSTAGALLALELLGRDAGAPLAFAIAGHHAGLADAAALRARLDGRTGLLGATRQAGGAAIPSSATTPPLPRWLASHGNADERARSAEMWTRMLFSALVDADRLDAEAWADQFLPERGRASTLRGGRPSLGALAMRLDAHLARFDAAPATPVNAYRRAVLAACREAVAQPPGALALTVDTGGGKTLAGLAFALGHALQHGLDRVIVVIPYTSIIEQTATVYRDALGDDAVLEHHHDVDPEAGDVDGRLDGRAERHRLATENWDVPVVVTTSVQFLESLLASTPGRCRKLHSVARSVVILDEVQTLPPRLLLPIVDVLRELVAHYRCTIVLSTATPPALRGDHADAAGRRLPGLPDVREIVPATVARPPGRVKVEWLEDARRRTPLTEVARAMAEHERALAIVHRRADARELFHLVRHRVGDGAMHLSALMCPLHRSVRLTRIREALRTDAPVRVVSTQVVEAGVDLDFPVVFRAHAGIDSMVQAAGRCNREGLLGPGGGRLILFRAESEPPPGELRTAESHAHALWMEAGHEGRPLDIFEPEVGRRFFRRLYADAIAGGDVQCARERFDFAQTAELFRLIDDSQTAVVVPHAGAEEHVEALRAGRPTRRTFRELQRRSVGIWPHQLRHLESRGAVERFPNVERMVALHAAFARLYDDDIGLDLAREPGVLIT